MRTYVTLVLILVVNDLFSQTNFPDLSPKGRIKQKVGFTTISVDYERPAVRGREIFGELVPYNKLWRTGAGNCTKIRFSDPVVISNQIVNSGTYSLLTVPDHGEWTVIREYHKLLSL